MKHAFLSFLLISFLLFNLSSFLLRPAVCFENESEERLRFKLRRPLVESLLHSIKIENHGSSDLIGVKLFVPLIRNETSRHFVLIREISATEELAQIVTDSSGNKYALWRIDKISKGQSFTVNISYFIMSFDIAFLIEDSLVQEEVENGKEGEIYTISEPNIESDNKVIVEKAREIVGNETNIHKQVLLISKFITEFLKYELQPDERGALWALQNGVGDCSEYSYLFVALCRALGIPARIQAGFAFHRLDETSEYGHMWAEYYLKNYGWIPVDLTWGFVDNLDNLHFSSLQSSPVFFPYDNYHLEYFQSPGVKVEDQQVIRVLKTPTEVFKEFEVAYKTYLTVSTIQNAEQLQSLTEKMGARAVLLKEFQELKSALDNADLKIQRALEEADSSFLNSAMEEAERADQLARDILFKNSVIAVSFVFVVISAFMALSSRRKTVEPY